MEENVLHYILSQVLQYEPGCAVSLLQVNSLFHRATAKALYEEVYIQDDDDSFMHPPALTRLETVQRYPDRYADLVLTLVLVPPTLSLGTTEEKEVVSYMDQSRQRLSAKSLGLVLLSLPCLEAFIWATDRMPFQSMCSVIFSSSPHLLELLIRPTISDQAHSQHRLASQEGFYASTSVPQRWDGLMMQHLGFLQTIHVSGLSVDGIRELQRLLQNDLRLVDLAVDSQFVDDALLGQVAELKNLKKLLIRSSGTKMTDKGITAIMEKCETLQSVTLTEVEGRLQKSFWSKLTSVPRSFDSLRLAFNEEGPHHSWVTDHLSSIFDVLELSLDGLKTFSLTRLTPRGNLIPITCHTQEGMVLNNGNGDSAHATMLKRVFSSPCDDVVRPRPFTDQALDRIVNFGFNLKTLELDMFVMSVSEFRSILESCKKLQYLRILLDAPFSKVLTMSSAFVSLNELDTLVLSITDTHCPKQALIVTKQTSNKDTATSSGNSTTLSSPLTRRQSDMGANDCLAEVSPASTHASLAQSEPEITHPTSSPRASVTGLRRSSISTTSSVSIGNLALHSKTGTDEITTASVHGIQGSVGSFDTSIPPKREIRKFARRCPSLRVLRWTGRNGKGEWRIAAGSSSIHAHIDFVPVHLVEDEESERITLGTGADVEEFIKLKRSANVNHPGKQTLVEEVDVVATGLAGTVEEQQGTDLERTPSADVKAFPHRKSGASDLILSRSEKGVITKGKKKGSLKESGKEIDGSKAQLTVKETGKGAVLTKKAIKTYADISDPTRTKADVNMIKAETRMTVLGESNRRKEGMEQMAIGAWTPTLPTSPPPKARTVTRLRAPIDGCSGATIIIGQGKMASSTSIAAAKRGKKKGSTMTTSKE